MTDGLHIDPSRLTGVHAADADAPRLADPVYAPDGDAAPGVDDGVSDLGGVTMRESAFRRDRLLSALVLLLGLGLFLAAPFILRAGSEFFMPVTVALVIALMLVPLLEWLERHRIPSGVAALLSLLAFLLLANAVIITIVVPAIGWGQLVPSHAQQIHDNLKPVLDLFHSLDRTAGRVANAVGARAPRPHAGAVAAPAPTSLVEIIVTSAPAVFIQFFFGGLLIYFFLASWSRMREAAIRSRETLTGSLRIARLLRDVVSNTAAYLLTVAIINLAVGALVALAAWQLGMPTPLMWGGLAAIFNFIPYAGPIIVVGLLGLGGLVAYTDPLRAIAPAGVFIVIHIIESNIVTPRIVGRRLTISPLIILISLSYWGWIWGAVGALVSVPLLIMAKVVLDRVGRPDIFGFLFDGRTLTRTAESLPPSEP